MSSLPQHSTGDNLKSIYISKDVEVKEKLPLKKNRKA